MKVYVGYIIGDCAIPIVMGRDYNKVLTHMNDTFPLLTPQCYIEMYDLDEDNVIKFD